MTPDEAFLIADADDRRAALAAAAQIASSRGDVGLTPDPVFPVFVLGLAENAYRWLRSRDTLIVTSIRIIPGTPHKEGTAVTTTFNLDDTDEVTFSLTGQDAKNAAVPLPAGFTAAWSLADPDSSGATLTPSADTTTAVLAAGTPDTNLMVSVTVTMTNADGSTSTLSGAEAVVVQATAATTVGLVPGTPVLEAPPAAPAA